MAFSKSESSSISLVPAIKAAEAAWRTSRVPWKEVELGELECVGWRWELGFEGWEMGGRGWEGEGSPRSMKTSQMRSWAGKGIE